jgi:hypothetical protein
MYYIRPSAACQSQGKIMVDKINLLGTII